MTTIGDHFIHVHIALCTAACLPDHQRERVGHLAFKDLIAYQSDEIAFFSRQYSGFHVGDGGRFLQEGESPDDLARHAVDILCDPEIVDAALCLCAEIRVDGHFHFAHRVLFDPVIHDDCI